MRPTKTYRLQWARHQKRWFGKWHIYLGIISGLILAVVGFTGSILTFQDEIDAALNKNLFEVQEGMRKIPLEAAVSLVREKYPGLTFDYAMNENDAPGMAYRFYDFASEKEFFINPYTGTLSGKRLYESSFIRVVMDIHTSLLVPKAGEYITGIAALILLILTISGLRLWIPQKWKQLKSVLTVKFSGSFKRQNYDWHNVIGFYSSPVVIFLSLTGVCITFSVVIVPMLFMLSGKSPKSVEQIFDAHSGYTKNAVRLSPEQAAAVVYRQMPDSRIGGIALPGDSTGTYRFDMLSPGLPEDGKREMLIIDQYSGRTLLNSRKDFPQAGNAYLAWLTSLHYGSFGGMPTKILACLGGLSPLALLITGFLIWYPRWRKQKRSGNKQITQAEDETMRPATPTFPITSAKQTSAVSYFLQQLGYGFKYALWILLITAAMGALYGMAAGIIVQPVVFGIAFTTVLVVINFSVAALCFLINVVFLLPFRKGSKMLLRYFSLSLGFCVVFLICYMLLMNTGIHFF
jgi:uncharacterized iron-regulated membrane protein